MASSRAKSGLSRGFGILVSMVFLGLSQAANSSMSAGNTTTGSVFVYNSTASNTQLVFAINADIDTDDFYFHLAAPAGNSWLGIGFGDKMANTKMLIAYASENGTGVTLSPRRATGHSEPVFDLQSSCDLIWDRRVAFTNGVFSVGPMSGYLTLDGVCRNATQWLGEEPSTSQPMIFAVGSGNTMQSDRRDAALRRHSSYGHFVMDIRAAMSKNASVPLPNGVNGTYTTLHSSDTASDIKQDGNSVPFLHGFGMCVVFVLVFPFGSLLLRVLNKVKLHAAVQIFGYVLLILAMAGGIHVSKQYNRSKDLKSAHQVLGLIVVIAVSAQLGLGIVNHSLVKRTQNTGTKKTALAKIHLFLGPSVIVLGIINGGIGFNFAGNSFLGKRYAIVVIAIALLYLAARLTIHFCTKRRKEIKEDEMLEMTNGPEGYRYPQFGPPPAYQAPPTYVHQQYSSQGRVYEQSPGYFSTQGAANQGHRMG